MKGFIEQQVFQRGTEKSEMGSKGEEAFVYILPGS